MFPYEDSRDVASYWIVVWPDKGYPAKWQGDIFNCANEITLPDICFLNNRTIKHLKFWLLIIPPP